MFNTDLNTKIDEVKNKIPDVIGLMSNTVLNKKIGEVGIKKLSVVI